MKNNKIILGFLLALILTVVLGSCSATIYKVGDSDGWMAKEDVYYEWAERKNFHVGDSLVFDYDRNLNDVTQVSGALEYEFCVPSSPKAVYNTGHDVVTFTEPGFYYFITSNYDNCKSGQKLDVLAVHDRSRPLPPPPTQDNLPLGKIHMVGDSKGWGVYEDSELYHKYSEKNLFHVGDNLLFQYDTDHEDVYEISGELEFMNCSLASPVSVHNSGHDLIKLTEPGVRYFISSKTGQCAAGVKLRVMVTPTTPNAPKPSLLDRLKQVVHHSSPSLGMRIKPSLSLMFFFLVLCFHVSLLM